MRSLFSILFFIFSSNVICQDTSILSAFDFWVGEWDAKWTAANGNEIIGHNTITKELDGKVVREQFSDPSTGFLGTSISVFSPADSLWHQAWADNSGGYIDLVGVIDGEKRIFQTQPVVSVDKTIIRRMVFYNIQPDSFDWDWEISQDGGKTWTLSWAIKYTRSESKSEK